MVLNPGTSSRGPWHFLFPNHQVVPLENGGKRREVGGMMRSKGKRQEREDKKEKGTNEEKI